MYNVLHQFPRTPLACFLCKSWQSKPELSHSRQIHKMETAQSRPPRAGFWKGLSQQIVFREVMDRVVARQLLILKNGKTSIRMIGGMSWLWLASLLSMLWTFIDRLLKHLDQTCTRLRESVTLTLISHLCYDLSPLFLFLNTVYCSVRSR